MNSYNENLNSSVVASLQSQELEQNKMGAQLNAAMFTLYYAQGAKITAQEKLDAVGITYDFQQQVKEKAVTNNNIATNLFDSATQEKQYVAQTVTNTSVAAANVQLAANAVLRLASDMGSVLNMLNAGDFGSQIYELANEVNTLMNDTAFSAEYTSQLAMEASSMTAEVSASTVADKSKATSSAVSNLLSVVSSQFDATAAVMASENASLALSCVAEKKAEGDLEDINTEYFASQAAYLLSIKQLNLNLLTVPTRTKGPDYSYTVSFDNYLNPFFTSPELKKYHNCPVSDYYIMLVKDSKKSTFSIARAEDLVLKEMKRQYIQIPHNSKAGLNKIVKEIFTSDLYDTDNEAMEMGESYVIFVMAVFTEQYKKALNNFDDYLTAPSASFVLTNELSSPEHAAINVVTIPVDTAGNKGQVLEFALVEDKQFKVEYRCMFLPDNTDLIEGLLTERGLRRIEDEVQKREEIAEKYDPAIMQDEADIVSCNTLINSLLVQIEVNQAHAERTPALDAELQKLEQQLKAEKAVLRLKKADLAENQKNKKAAMDQIQVKSDIKPGFFFNLALAEQVTDGSYAKSSPFVLKDRDTELDIKTSYDWFSSAMRKKHFAVSTYKKAEHGIHFTISKAGHSETIRINETERKGLTYDLSQVKDKEIKGQVEQLLSGYTLIHQQLIIDDTITDNFGNPLIDKKKYVPVILSYSTENQGVNIQFTNALSAYADTRSFIYKEKAVTNK
ncbi:MAG: hypothetical protein HYZ14_07340 [Bacteroidetes bacterium]|nr:hypothetical protein [Bacteroidota bacterium]